jgi:hypothetical protein
MTDLQEKVRDDITTKGPHGYAKSSCTSAETYAEPSHEIACSPRSSERQSVKGGNDSEETLYDALEKSKR